MSDLCSEGAMRAGGFFMAESAFRVISQSFQVWVNVRLVSLLIIRRLYIHTYVILCSIFPAASGFFGMISELQGISHMIFARNSGQPSAFFAVFFSNLPTKSIEIRGKRGEPRFCRATEGVRQPVLPVISGASPAEGRMDPVPILCFSSWEVVKLLHFSM